MMKGFNLQLLLGFLFFLILYLNQSLQKSDDSAITCLKHYQPYPSSKETLYNNIKQNLKIDKNTSNRKHTLLFSVLPAKGHYNPMVNYLKYLLNNHNDEFNIILMSMNAKGKANISLWLENDFPKEQNYHVEPLTSSSPLLSPSPQKVLYYFNIPTPNFEFDTNFSPVNISIFELFKNMTKLSTFIFNTITERYIVNGNDKNLQIEKPDVFIIDCVDPLYGWIDSFEQLNEKYETILISFCPTVSEILESDMIPLWHPPFVAKSLYGKIIDKLGKSYISLHPYYSYFNLFSENNIKFNPLTTIIGWISRDIIIPIFRWIGYYFAIKSRQGYNTHGIIRPLNKWYHDISRRYPYVMLGAKGVLEPSRMRSYPGFYDIGLLLEDAANEKKIAFDKKNEWVYNLLRNIEGKKEELIFISMGSVWTLNWETNRNIVNGLKLLMQQHKTVRVLFRVPNDQFEYISNIVKENNLQDKIIVTSDYLPQVDILNNNRTTLFITHCGFNSVNEGLFYGKKLVGLPISADQYILASYIEKKEYGRFIPSSMIESNSFKNVVLEVLLSDKMERNVKWASKQLKRTKPGKDFVKIIKSSMEYYSEYSEANEDLRVPYSFWDYPIPYLFERLILPVITFYVLKKVIVWFVIGLRYLFVKKKELEITDRQEEKKIIATSQISPNKSSTA
ncbi:hypothetical protein ABK040_008050 [Willaertia magna]